jgi:hypothetical protein
MSAPQSTTVEAFGQKWTFSHRMEWGTLKGFFAWIREQEGDQFAEFERFHAILPDAEKGKAFKDRQERRDQLKSLNLDSPIAREYQMTPDGIGWMAAALLRVNHPDITIEKAFQVMQEIDPAVAAEIKRKAAENAKGSAKNERGGERPPKKSIGRIPLAPS